MLPLAPRGRLLGALLVPVLAGLMVLAGCGSSAKPAGKSPTEVMAAAKKNLDEASSVHMTLATGSTPSTGNGVLGANGDLTHAPAFEGDVKVQLSGLTATIPVTSVGGKVYAKLPMQTKFTVVNPVDYGAPDPAAFADPDHGLSSLLTQLEGVKKTGEKRSGDQVLTSYSGTLPGAAVKTIIPSADANGTYKTVVGVDPKDRAITVKVTGTFFSGASGTTYDVVLSQYGKGVQITAPPV